jgi:hypothetical protein
VRAWANLYPWDVAGTRRGPTELRLYHAGLAAAPDLAAIGHLCSKSA